MTRSRLPLLVLPLAALLLMVASLGHGVSAGQDLGFHTLSWLDAAAQLRHGVYPQWATTPAWHAGEPRFVLYPPLSWLVGALLTMMMPIEAAIRIYLWLVMCGAGLAMYRLARAYASPAAAMLAAAFYMANPYLMFCALERSAMAELMATVWLPLLLLGALRARPTVPGIALPLALLWLTNAPAAVMGSYVLALIAVDRVGSEVPAWRRRSLALAPLFALSRTYLGGTLLGLALPAFYLLPAAYERRYVQVAMAVIPNMRFQDNFLFAHTADAPHNAVNRTASLLALCLLAMTVAAVSAAMLSQRQGDRRRISTTLALLTFALSVLLVPISTPLWQHLPNLMYLQFPWRWLMVLAAVLALAIALSLETLRLSVRTVAAAAPVIALALGSLGFHFYYQPPQPTDDPNSWALLFRSGHGAPPTDEYTPNDADNDLLRTNNPAWWLGAEVNTPAPDTLVNPATLTGDYDAPVAPAHTLSRPVPRHLEIDTAAPGFLILNLRAYPRWQVVVSDECSMERHSTTLPRDDGLLAVPIFCGGRHTVDIGWRRTEDQTLGVAVSLVAVGLLAAATLRRRARVESV